MTKAVKSYVYDDFSCQSYKLEFTKSLTIIMGPPYFVKLYKMLCSIVKVFVNNVLFTKSICIYVPILNIPAHATPVLTYVATLP